MNKNSRENEIVKRLRNGEEQRKIARDLGLSRGTIRWYASKHNILPSHPVGERYPRLSDEPYSFSCCHCHKIVTVDPSIGDKRYKFCSQKCEKAYWRHQDRNAGIRCPIYKLQKDGSLIEVTR